MTIAEFVQAYGYWAVLGGSLVEGETVLLMAGYAAHRGYLSLPWVIALAFVGSLTGDQVAFLVGRRFGPYILRRWPTWQERVERIRARLERHRIPLMLGFRFVYGIRIAAPVAFGVTGVRPGVFAPLNALGAALWSVVISCLGWGFGAAVMRVLGRVHHYEPYVLLAVVVAGLGVGWAVHRRRRRASPQAASLPPGLAFRKVE